MIQAEPKYRRPLNPKQLYLLKLIYKFRFVSAESLAKRSTKTEIGGLRKRLSVLVDQGHIGRNYNGSYRLQNKPANYFLLPKGILALKSERLMSFSGLKAAYKDRSASPQFIDHCLKVGKVYQDIIRLYGDNIKVASRTELAANEHFPKLKPDLYLISKDEPGYFLDLVDDSTPTFAYRKKVLAYINYFDDEWELSQNIPPLMIVCDTAKTEARVKRLILRIISNMEPELSFYITAVSRLDTALSPKGVWEQVTDSDRGD